MIFPEQSLDNYYKEVSIELQNILAYWTQHATDRNNGGFYGKIDNENKVYKNAPRGAVLNARILWTFSAAYNFTKEEKYLVTANWTYKNILQYFIDKEYGGIYWTVGSNGNPLDTKKQIYALAFLQYACSEYYQCNQLLEAKHLAIELYKLIEKHSFDKAVGGYFEAFSQDWKVIGDMRLSKKDANEKKTMNTHLHVLESYTTLYRIWPDENLKKSIRLLIDNFLSHIINATTSHLHLFFDEQWISKNSIVSYGHDIEAAWLIQEAAEVIEDELLIKKSKTAAVKLTLAAAEGLDNDGGLWYEKENGHLIKQKHWWPQAEAMVGFFNAWQVSNDERFLQHSLASWQFVKSKIIDKINGEWWWGIDEAGKPMQGEDKVGLWKCPYHNARACMEIMKRIHS
jgi:cellobiose epimerase